MEDNLHDDLSLIDPLVIIFDGKSLLNALLYGSDEFNNKIDKYFYALFHTGLTTPGWPRWSFVSPPVPTFFCGKKKKGKKRKGFKAETIKKLSPASKCYFLF